ncbi:MAG: PilT/PilU family type 4a pilus ATPase [Verrucomicrobia bacterium]|nr:PilT/PilU family type 4a pilus ATPase [Verrucomicrobiota bacterium]MBV9657671.1 PilT/PilU family type 4a pilus ATPase [Verrucomicrobiota bacterium]
MRTIELDAILQAMLQSYDGISDLNLSVGRPLQVEAFGRLMPIRVDPPIEALTAFQTEQIALNIIGTNRRNLRDLLQNGSCDCSYQLGQEARFRVNIFRQKGNFAIVMRKLNTDVPTFEALNLPDIFSDIVREKTGLVLVTGATGSGKTTTLAAMLNTINQQQPVHVVTLEDPIEYVHPHLLATFNQRELGSDFSTYPNGLRAALRQAPKVILVGEMRDRETVEIALTAAETGHLVLSTLHTIDAGQSLGRIVGMFELAEEKQVRSRLADTLRYVVSQRLAPQVEGGRHLLLEIMGHNLRTQEAVALGEDEGRGFYEIIEASESFGWVTFDRSILNAYEAGLLDEETALLFSTKKGKIQREIDLIKKARGEGQGQHSGLQLDLAAAGRY